MPMLPGRRKRRSDNRPIPAHPYRDTALVYAGMGVLLVIVATLTGGQALRAIAAAAIFFVHRDGVDLVGIPQADPRPRRGDAEAAEAAKKAAEAGFAEARERERQRKRTRAGRGDGRAGRGRWTRGSRRSAAISRRCGRPAGPS